MYQGSSLRASSARGHRSHRLRAISGKHVLVVDDDDLLGEVLVLVVRDEGYEAERAASLATARATLLRGRVDAVLLDLSLGFEDGSELLPSIRASAPDAKIIVMTGLVTREVRAWATRERVQVLLKPFERSRIIAELAAQGGREGLPASA